MEASDAKPLTKSTTILHLEELADFLDREGYELQKVAGTLRCICHTTIPEEAEHQMLSFTTVTRAYLKMTVIVRRMMILRLLEILKICTPTSSKAPFPPGES